VRFHNGHMVIQVSSTEWIELEKYQQAETFIAELLEAVNAAAVLLTDNHGDCNPEACANHWERWDAAYAALNGGHDA
jgi:hypothetical protein